MNSELQITFGASVPSRRSARLTRSFGKEMDNGMTTDATTGHLAPGTQNLTCSGTKNVELIRKSRKQFIGFPLVGSLLGLLIWLPIRGLDQWLLTLGRPRPWLYMAAMLLLIWWPFSRWLSHSIRWSEVKLRLSEGALHVCYPACQPALELAIPWSAISSLETETCKMHGETVWVRIGDSTVAQQVQTAVKSRFGSGLWLSTPWYQGLRILSDTPPATDVSNLLMVWRNRNSRPPAPTRSPPAAPSIPPTKPAPTADVPTEVDVSSSTYAELLSLPGIGPAEAALVLKCRVETGGPYSLEELATLLQLKPHSTERLRGKVAFSKPAPDVPSKPGRKPETTSTLEVKPPSGGREID